MLRTQILFAGALAVTAFAAATVGAAEPAYRMAAGHVQGATVVQGVGAPSGTPAGGYPQLNAPLYPSPVQYTPAWTGGTIITNQALAPHEMLYPHKYHAMYGPFYYKVRGSWFVTPFGVHQHEKWKLEGTHVKVKYHPHHKLFSGFFPPVSR